MKLSDILTIGGVFSAVIAVAGWWLKSRLETSIKYEYDQLFEAFKTEQLSNSQEGNRRVKSPNPKFEVWRLDP